MVEEETKKVEEKAEQKVESSYKLVEVTTQTAPAIQTPAGELISDSQAIVMLLNEMAQVKSLIA